MSVSGEALPLFKDVCDQLVVVLDGLASIAEERDTEETILKDRVQIRQKMAVRLRERVQNVSNKKTFKLAVVGEFNTGKSTFINALLKYEILSVSWKPCTAAKTVLRYGESERFKVSYLSGQREDIYDSNNLLEDIAKFTSDTTIDDKERLEGNVTLAKQIKEVEIWCKADFLRKREIDIVDTPGLGAVFPEHKEVTYGLIPEMDATMFLFPIDPGISEEDILFLRFMREHIKQIFFVMTKSDYARTPEEREERAKFNKTTIQVKASFKEVEMGHVYPVSARMELENMKRSGENETEGEESSESGFPTVVDELVRFLVSSSGVARLESPMEFAQERLQILFKSTEKDIQDVDKNLQLLKDELAHLESERIHVETAKDEMLRRITNSVENLKRDGTEGIELLPVLLQQAVERAIDSADRKQLRNKPERLLEVVIKEEVLKWVNKKVSNFDSTRERLQAEIEREMQSIVGRLERIEINSQQHGDELTQLNVTYSDKMFANAGLKIGMNMAGKATLLGAGAGGILLGGLLAGLVLPVILIVGVPVVTALTALGIDAGKVKPRLQQALKEQLKRPLPPPNRNNIYNVIVDGGYSATGPQQGLAREMTDTFSNWGNQLKNDVEEWVVNLLGSRITQLERSIREKESGVWNRENNLNRFQSELESLRDIEKDLLIIKTTMDNMRKGVFDTAKSE
jgi:GTP-binding protein EngB required for normal cell division